jgi:outer membrane cobalamin receptor
LNSHCLIRACLSLFAACGAEAQTAQNVPTATGAGQGDLTQVSIENLLNMEVTSVSKKEQKLSRTAAAVFVVTQEGIRNSGELNIPDVLRLVPGVDVAQIDANTWAIRARGLNGVFSNELLVLIDGRNVYIPATGTPGDFEGLPVAAHADGRGRRTHWAAQVKKRRLCLTVPSSPAKLKVASSWFRK